MTILLNRASGDASAVDDLYQETFQIALEKILRGGLREPERLSGFICSLARNLVIDHFRKASVRRILGRVEETGAAHSAPDALEDRLRFERASIVRRVLAELPSWRDREILFRFYIAEDEKDAICRDLWLTSLHFNRVLFRARVRYRELYEKTTRMNSKEPRQWTAAPHFLVRWITR